VALKSGDFTSTGAAQDLKTKIESALKQYTEKVPASSEKKADADSTNQRKETV
jgi:hypothetical protein